MIEHLERVARCLIRLGFKRLLSIVLITAMLMMPAELLHFVAVIAHTLYETIAFAIEAFLVHHFEFSKFQAQMIVFYSSFVSGVLLAIALIRRIPQLVANIGFRVSQSYAEVRNDWQQTWQALPNRQRLRLMLLNFVGLFSMLVLLTS